MKNPLLILLCATCIVGCSSHDNNGTEIGQDKGISFTSSINPLTKATSSNFESDDAISVFSVKESASNTIGKLYGSNYADNIKYIYSGSHFSSSTPITYPENDSKLFFYAVYPYQSSAASTFTFNVNNDQSSSNNYTQSDLMTASTAATSELVPDLKFSHRLSNIILNITFEQAPTNAVSTIFKNVMGSASVDLNSNTFSGTGSVDANIVAATNGTNSFRAILPPQSIASGAQFCTIKVGDVEYKVITPDNIVWKSGVQYQYNVTIKKPGEVTFTSEINPWGEAGTIDDVVPPTIQDNMKPYITIHNGSNPPNIEGTYYIDPMSTVYCEDGAYAPGKIVNSLYIRFTKQDNSKLSIEYEEESQNNNDTSTGTGAFISGSNNDFTVYLNTTGTSSGITYKTALVISGTKTSTGISGLRYAFVMEEKGADPNSILMKTGVFRVFEDKDGLSVNSTWPTTTKALVNYKSGIYQWNCLDNVLRRKYE